MRIVLEGVRVQSADTEQEGSEPPAKRMRMSGHHKDVTDEIIGEAIKLFQFKPSFGARVQVYLCFSPRRLPEVQEMRPEALRLSTTSEILRSRETCRTDAASVGALKCELPSKANTRNIGGC